MEWLWIDVAAHNSGILIALLALIVLAVMAWGHEPSCLECPHCTDEKRKRQERDREFNRRFLGLPPDKKDGK